MKKVKCGFSAIAFLIKVNGQIDSFFPSQFIDDFTVSWQFLSRTTPEKERVELYQPLNLVQRLISEFIFNLVLYFIE